MHQQFAVVFVFLALGIGLLIFAQALSKLLRPKNYYEAKHRPYECGEEPEGSPWIQFNVRFYLVALFFIVFDVEVVFMMPWAVAFNDMLEKIGPLAFWEMAIFVLILVIGLAYVWAKGDLLWVKGLIAREEGDVRGLSEYSSGEKLRGTEIEARQHG